MLNVGVNQTVAVYESNYGEVQKEGINLNGKDLNYWLGVLDTLSPEGKPSMRQDMEARRYSEVELFAGAVLELGRKHGIATPVNKELYDRIQFVESQY